MTEGLTRATWVTRGDGTKGEEGGKRGEEKFLCAGGPTKGSTRGPRGPKKTLVAYIDRFFGHQAALLNLKSLTFLGGNSKEIYLAEWRKYYQMFI